MSQDPDFTAAAAEAGDVFRALFPAPADVEASIRDALARSRAVGGAVGEMAAGLIEVMEVAHGWNVQSMNDPAATVSAREAADAIIDAVTRGMAG